MDDSVVRVVAADDTGWREAGIDGDFMQGIEAIGCGFTAKRLNVFPRAIESMDVVG